METTSKPKVTVPLVAAIPISYTFPIKFFGGKIDTSVKTSIKSNRTTPYVAADSSKKVCLSCSSQTTPYNSSEASGGGEQTSANIKISNMYNGSPMLILPFVSAKPSQIQQKTLPTFHNQQHPPSLYHPHAKISSDDSSRVI